MNKTDYQLEAMREYSQTRECPHCGAAFSRDVELIRQGDGYLVVRVTCVERRDHKFQMMATFGE